MTHRPLRFGCPLVLTLAVLASLPLRAEDPAPAPAPATPVAASESAIPEPGTLTAGHLVIVQPWSRASSKSAQAGAVFLHLDNLDEEAIGLTGATTPVAETVELHSHTTSADGVMHMGPVNSIDLPAHGHADLAPGGFHIMLIGLKQPLVAGQTFPLTLTFSDGDPVTVNVLVGAPAAMTAADVYSQQPASDKK